MQKGKKCFSVLLVMLLLIPILGSPAKAAELQTQTVPFAIRAVKQIQDEKDLANFINQFSSNRPFSSELLAHFICGNGDKTYLEEDVPEHIKEEIFNNEKIQEKLQYVLEKAYSAKHWQVVYIFDDKTQPYYDPETFDEKPILDSAGLAFTSYDMSKAVGHINGRLVIGADYLGDNNFSVWLFLTDLYDFDFNSDYGWLGIAANTMAVFQRLNVLRPYNLAIGFTRNYEWAPPTQVTPAPSNTTTAQPSITITQPQTSTQYPTSGQFYARGNYDIGNYTGDMLQGKPHGYGTLEYSNQTKYEIGMPDGGKFKATKYTGWWVNGIRCGQGTFTFANGVQYEGVWNTDGYYFSGYVKTGNIRQYIKQTASGDTIKTEQIGSVEHIK